MLKADLLIWVSFFLFIQIWQKICYDYNMEYIYISIYSIWKNGCPNWVWKYEECEDGNIFFVLSEYQVFLLLYSFPLL